MIDITQKQIDKGLKEYQYFLIGRTSGFITSLFETISHADTNNLNKLANIYPECVYAYLDYTGGIYRVNFNVVK